MDTSSVASGPNFRICPLCEESKLVFTALYEAHCPACDYEPGAVFLKTLRQIVALPEPPETRPERLRTQRSNPKESDEQKGASSEDD